MASLELGQRILKKMGFILDYEFLGSGSFGGVFRVEDEEGNFYALKMQKASEFNDREWETSQKIRSEKCPYLIEHFNLEHHGECVYLQLEYANARSLQELLVGKTCGMNKFSLRLMWQMLTGVNVLHKNKIIHRDLKADNILCHKAANGEITMKISDFGLARTVSSEVQAKTQCGTPLHMAPEIFAGVDYGAQADVWSLGVLFFQMATNGEVHPFPAQSFQELVQMINQPLQRDPRLFPSPEADQWWEVIRSMLNIKMRDRALVADVLQKPLFAPYKCEADFFNPPATESDPAALPPLPSDIPPLPAAGSENPSAAGAANPSDPAANPSDPAAAGAEGGAGGNPFGNIVTSANPPQAKKINKAGYPAPTPPISLQDGPLISTFPPCTSHYFAVRAKK